MNCPQCQAANGPDAGFCGSCGTQLAVAEPAAPLGYGAPSASGGYAPSGGYGAPSSAGAFPPPANSGGYPPPSSAGGYPPPSGGYGAPSGGNGASANGYGPPSGYGQAPAGYGQAPGSYNQAGPIPPAAPQQDPGYQQGQYQPPAGGWQAPRSSGPGGTPPVSFDLNRATTVDKVVAVATFITMISIWLPWYTVSVGTVSFSFSGTSARGWLWLEFILALALIAYLVARVAWETMPFSMPVAHDRLLLGGTAVQLLLILIAFFDIPSGFGWGFGAFLGLLGALVAAGPIVVPAVRAYLAARKAGGGHSY